MKTKFVTIGVLMAALAVSATAFADDAGMQMNDQMGQAQAQAQAQAVAPAEPAMPEATMPTTANTQATNPAPQADVMPDTATGSADDINTPSSNY